MNEAETPLEGGDLLRFVYTCPLALLLLDKEGRIELLNGAASSLLMPFSRDGDLENLFDLIEPGDPVIRAFLIDNAAKLKTGQVVRRVPMHVGMIDRTFCLSFTFGRFDDGYSVTVQDVTDLVAKEEENKELLAREAHERGRVEVASGILHDLGNALTGISMRAVDIRGRIDDDGATKNLDRLVGFLRPHAEGLDSVLGTGKGQALLTMLDALLNGIKAQRNESADSMKKMLTFIAHAQELLAINRTFAAPGSDPAKGTSSLRKVMDDLLMMTSESVSKRGGRIETDFESTLPAVRIDRSRLMQVLINLVKNATEAYDLASADDALLLRLTMNRDAAGDLLLEVKDNGCGFDPATQEKLFDHGFSTKQRGSGEGLSGCRRIIAAYGGEIRLESEGPGCGATATVVLPKDVFDEPD